MASRYFGVMLMSLSLVSLGAAAQAQTSFAQASLDNIYVRPVYTGTTVPNHYYFLQGRETDLSSTVSVDGSGSDTQTANGLLFDTPAATVADIGTAQATAAVDGPLGEIRTAADGLPPSWWSSYNRAEATVTQQVHVKIERGTSLQVNGRYSISAASGTPEFAVIPGTAEFSVRFDSFSAQGMASVEFKKSVYAGMYDPDVSMASGFELIAVNPYDYAIEGILTFYSHSYVGVSAVPEPGTYMMLGAGLLVLAGSGLRRQRQAGTQAT